MQLIINLNKHLLDLVLFLHLMKIPNDYFKDRKLVFVTQHQKHIAVFPVLEDQLECELVLCNQIDTNQFGSFSGEVKRLNDAYQTAVLKCDAAHQKFGYNLVMASEGSFGSHPQIPFLPSNQELLLLKDYKYNFVVSATITSLETNFFAENIKSFKGLLEFAQKVKFPSHAVILKDRRDQFIEIHKGINNQLELEKIFKTLLVKYGQVYVETDMRACYNPSRQRVIGDAAQKLLKQLHSTCPKCRLPGFQVTSAQKGLKCSACQLPTNSILYQEYVCQNCNYILKSYYPNHQQFSDPMYCNFCNP
ncbi:DUF6671 family protein [Psychroflexus sp. ALD_RP9]|uniref:DUF6671 family protein n=1 Tax=Psychroflexus sp. ALD_RP9 TaxID=2777186 RepID=UPI001A8F249D|nr:DUF6671 family protein [Psychroflexus sp. ALD_RP9]QSS96055.1 hypothetical protein IMZ30_06180 [Psychroflexus sp. ALD_RP9]